MTNRKHRKQQAAVSSSQLRIALPRSAKLAAVRGEWLTHCALWPGPGGEGIVRPRPTASMPAVLTGDAMHA